MTTTPQTAAAFEDDLPVVAALDQIDHFRIITKSGESRKATPAQVRELCGIDYSILTEQAVPGEYFLSVSGERKQIYTRTFADTFPATMPDYKTFEFPSSTPIPTGLVEAHGRVKLGGNTWQMASDVFVFTALNRLALSLNGKEDWLGAKYIVTLKYTK